MPAADGLAARLQALEDREAIRDLIARYGPAADSGDAEGAAALFDEAGVYAVGGMGESHGRPAIAALLHGPIHQQLMADGCAHLLGPVAIDLTGNTATARGLSLVFRWNGSHWETVRASANRWHLTRGAAGWAVKRRDNALLDGNAAARALLAAG
jgi:uncharacterized protein (TIGR02246 family)